MNSPIDIKEKKVKNQGNVKSTTLDYLLSDCKEPIAFIKLDIEGCELQALQGSTTIIEKYKPVIAAEAFGDQEKTELVQFLKQYGYSIVKKFTRGTPMYVFSTSITDYAPVVKRILGL